jgi:hypothetical protein
VAQRAELRLDAVQLRGVERGVGQLDVVRLSPGAHLLTLVGTEVVQHEAQPDFRWIEGADVAAELQKLRAGLAFLDVPVEPVGRDVVGGDQVSDAVRAGVRSRIRRGLARGAQLLPPGWG